MRQTAYEPVGLKQGRFVLRYWTGWQQVHGHLVTQTEVSPTALPAGGSGVTYRRRAVNFRCRRYLVDARSGFRSGDQPVSTFQERPQEQKRRVRAGHHHGSQTCIGYRGYRCDCLPGLGPGGSPAFDLNDCDEFSWCAREKTCRRGSN